MRIIVIGKPRRGKSTFCRKLSENIGFRIYCADPVTLVKDPEDGVTYLDETYADPKMWSAASEFIRDSWFPMTGPWIMESVSLVRALRKFHDMYPKEPPPCDRLVAFMGKPLVKLNKGQETMSKGIDTIYADIAEWLAPYIEFIEPLKQKVRYDLEGGRFVCDSDS